MADNNWVLVGGRELAKNMPCGIESKTKLLLSQITRRIFKTLLTRQQKQKYLTGHLMNVHVLIVSAQCMHLVTNGTVSIKLFVQDSQTFFHLHPKHLSHKLMHAKH